MTLALRPATLADATAVLTFWATAAEDAHRPPDSTAAIDRLLTRDPDALLLAVDGDRVVGTVIAGWDGWRCHLYRLAVAPNRRREGIGRELVSEPRPGSRRSAGRGSTPWCSTTTSRRTARGRRRATPARPSGRAG